jgi:serine/threonine protein kinase
MNFSEDDGSAVVDSEGIEALQEEQFVIEPANFIEDDPSKQYNIVSKIGAGGFARVFLCKRASDGSHCALKFMEPKNEKERELIKNELAVM